MNRPFTELAELQTLLDALCEETITPEQVRRLEELVLGHPEAEAHYVQYMSLQADLVGHFGALSAGVEQSLRERVEGRQRDKETGRQGDKETRKAAVRFRLRRPPRLLVSLAALAAVLLLALALWKRPSGGPKIPLSVPEETDHTVAVLLQAPGAEWEETGLPTRAGAALPPGLLRLKSGFAHIEFYSGATVILEGPAEFHLLSRMEAYCASGKLRATVPQHALGFVIGSPRLQLVDRGTEFGLHVGAGDRTEVHVFQGKVELHDAGGKPAATPRKELTTGESVRLEGDKDFRPIASDSGGFRTAQELAQRSEIALRERHQKWQTAREGLRRDPDLLVYYAFQADEPWSRTALDEARVRQQPHDGAIIGCVWATGRWPGKQALEFKRVSDRVRLHVPGEFESLTLAAWVRLDGLPNQNNSLLMSDGWDEGELHWQIGKDGTLILGVQSRPKKGTSYHAVEAITPDRFGQWLHLAVVYDRDAGQVTHYLDGQPISQVPLQFNIPLRVGDAALGNWNLAMHRNNHPVRFFSGCMDEFMLFSRALSDEEVERLSTHGRPAP